MQLGVTLIKALSCLSLSFGLVVIAMCAEPTTAHAETGTAIAYVLPGNTMAGELERLRGQAQQAYQTSQFERSLPLYQHIAASGVATANDLYWLGESYSRMGQFANAAQAFEGSLKLEASNDLLKLRLAESFLAARQMPQAKAACENGINSARDQSVRLSLSILLKVCQKPLPEMVCVALPSNTIKVPVELTIALFVKLPLKLCVVAPKAKIPFETVRFPLIIMLMPKAPFTPRLL